MESLQILSVGWLVVTHNPRYSVTNINHRDHRDHKLPGLRIDRLDLEDSGEFQCQVLNRDVWSNQSVKAVVSEHFLLWQVRKISCVQQ